MLHSAPVSLLRSPTERSVPGMAHLPTRKHPRPTCHLMRVPTSGRLTPETGTSPVASQPAPVPAEGAGPTYSQTQNKHLEGESGLASNSFGDDTCPGRDSKSRSRSH